MKKTNIFILVAGILALSSCASTSQGKTQEVSSSKTVSIERIDWKGAAIGEDIPSWAGAALNGDTNVFSKMPQFEGKVIFFAENTGKNLNILKSWTDNFNAQKQFSTRLSSYVQQKFGGELKGSNEEEGDEQTYLQELVNSFSRNEINGFGKELDYWVQTRRIDKLNKTVEDTYQYFVVYAIDENLYKQQIKAAIEDVPAKTQKQSDMKSDVERGIFEVQVWAETQE